MRTATELVNDAQKAIEQEDYAGVTEIVCEALGHLYDFSWKTGEEWPRDTVKECCYDIGELIYRHGDIAQMKEVYTQVYYEMKGVAARYLERFWHGCGDGEWQG